jgi:3',5'-cyclic AMP phosphodiesterase CpdA
MAVSRRLIGPGGRLYADPEPGPDEATFRVDNTSAAYYQSPYYVLHRNEVQQIPAPRANTPLQLNLADFLPAEISDAIRSAGRISFNAVGDTGAAKVDRSQTVATAIAHEAAVTDALAAEAAAVGPDAPAFLFHLGDVVYNFGEAQYYYDQFYEPFRAYDRPIFAIPGNHDGAVFGPDSTAPQVHTLAAFLRNFCAAAPGPSPDAGGLVRSVMNQPGVYFTLDAPFVSIIGLYSNVLEGPGVLSSQGGHYPIGDEQVAFLQSELRRLRPDRKAGKRAVVLALHHPPLSADAKHGGSTGAQLDIDNACAAADLWPDLVLSGHAHLYQRFTRRVGPGGQEAPYVVAGSGGFAATPPQVKLGPAPITVGDHTLEIDPIVKFGYLTVTTDARTLTVSFRSPTAKGNKELDSVTVNLVSNKIVTAGSGLHGRAAHGKPHRPGKGRRL